MTVFTPLQNFRCDELRSEYCVGLSYTLKPANDPAIADNEAHPTGLRKRNALARKNRAILAEMLPKWLAEGKVALGVPTAAAPIHGAAKIEGQGDVSGGN